MELWTAILIGFGGSLHCVGMCGPLAMALPVGKSKGWLFYFNRLMYNLGRVTTYALIGGLFGLFGKGLALAGMQQFISIAFGVMLLLGVLFVSNWESKFLKYSGLHYVSDRVRRGLSALIGKPGTGHLYLLGILNGLLPCGFVYLGVLGAISTGSVLSGMGYMALFGLGTVPAMLAVSVVGIWAPGGLKKAIRRLTPVIAIAFAGLFILRGLNLGIPYVSPKIADGIEHVKCH